MAPASKEAKQSAAPSTHRSRPIRSWALLSFAFLLVFLWVTESLPHYYGFKEGSFLRPVGEPFVVRNDEMGKGHFGASRSRNRTHDGIDLAAELGEPVFAAKSGRVRYSGQNGGYGQFVSIEHPDGRHTRYAHLSTLRVRSGAWVDQGVPIGTVGKTGNASHDEIIPHLHFEILQKDAALDPLPFLNEHVTYGAEGDVKSPV